MEVVFILCFNMCVAPEAILSAITKSDKTIQMHAATALGNLARSGINFFVLLLMYFRWKL